METWRNGKRQLEMHVPPRSIKRQSGAKKLFLVQPPTPLFRALPDNSRRQLERSRFLPPGTTPRHPQQHKGLRKSKESLGGAIIQHKVDSRHGLVSMPRLNELYPTCVRLPPSSAASRAQFPYIPRWNTPEGVYKVVASPVRSRSVFGGSTAAIPSMYCLNRGAAGVLRYRQPRELSWSAEVGRPMEVPCAAIPNSSVLRHVHVMTERFGGSNYGQPCRV